METAPLKSFATWARTELIREVTARIAVVLAQASRERVEQPKSAAALEKAVSAAGGGDKGRSAAADRVAYTWFNRIIALRFMDANGYTGIGVVSPQAGVDGGQPEILAEAKRGNIDPEVVSEKIRETVTALLNGTRRSDDPQGEAYALLLAAYCRHWNRFMPFMFEREGDYTELLIPADLLADDSVLARAVTVLTDGVCQDVEAIGWLYQFYISELKDQVFAGFKKGKKAGAAEIAAATQLFTPHWIVRYLVENSLGRLWLLNRPTSRLAEEMEYYIPPADEETDYLKISRPEELTIIDPACGSGHMLTYAFDLLYAIYEEEGYAPSDIPGLILANNIYGVEIDPRAGTLAAFALSMKARARQRTFFNKKLEPNICVLEPISFTRAELDILSTSNGDADHAFWNRFQHADTFGSLIQPDGTQLECFRRSLVDKAASADNLIIQNIHDRAAVATKQAELLSRTYSVVVTNPPYMGNRNMGTELSTLALSNYPQSKADLYAMFVERCISLAAPSGQVGMITMQSWMFLNTFKKLRLDLIDRCTLRTMAHLGTNAFDTISGEVVATTAFTLARCSDQRAGQYVDLCEGSSESKKADQLRAAIRRGTFFLVPPQQLKSIEGAPLAYWLPDALRATFREFPPLGSRLRTTTGLNTGDNDRFVRLWHEVSFDRVGLGCESLEDARKSGKTWFPYNKGGGHRKWYGNQAYLLNWSNDGRELKELATQRNSGRHWSRFLQNLDVMFKECLTWSFITTRSFSARFSPTGFLFDVGGPSGIPFAEEDTSRILALVGSALMPLFMKALNPTVNFQIGDLARVPFAPSLPFSDSPQELLPVALSRKDWDLYERSWDFRGSPLIASDPKSVSVESAIQHAQLNAAADAQSVQRWEEQTNRMLVEGYHLSNIEVETDVPLSEITLTSNPNYRFMMVDDPEERIRLQTAEDVRDLVSYGVGCMFGRYSLDKPGLVLANQASTLADYYSKVTSPSFAPDSDNVLPVVDGDWFDDDIVGRFREFLRVAFGDSDTNFERNLRFVTESLGVRELRDYFVKSFYKDHVQRYKKRPIYWLFSSPKGSFNALIYMHRYTPSTVSTVLNEYLREFKAKVESSLQHHERLVAGGGTARQQAAAQKEADRLRKVLLELDQYEHDVLYPLASQQIEIDLDDGVKANYPKFGAALKKIPGLEASE